jgi:membrane protein required for beta-lactamase induction
MSCAFMPGFCAIDAFTELERPAVDFVYMLQRTSVWVLNELLWLVINHRTPFSTECYMYFTWEALVAANQEKISSRNLSEVLVCLDWPVRDLPVLVCAVCQREASATVQKLIVRYGEHRGSLVLYTSE